MEGVRERMVGDEGKKGEKGEERQEEKRELEKKRREREIVRGRARDRWM